MSISRCHFDSISNSYGSYLYDSGSIFGYYTFTRVFDLNMLWYQVRTLLWLTC